MSEKKQSYRELRAQLDEILTRLQSGELDIEAVTKEYERATKIVETLEAYLKKAENTITKIKK